MAREIGLSCWQRSCRNQFSYTIPKGMRYMRAIDTMEGEAGKLGWVIGHWDGQAYFACPDCKDSLWDPLPLRSLRFVA